MVPLGLSSATRSGTAHDAHEAVPTAVAAVVTLVPEGLILLASLTFAVAALPMARRGALVQQLNAIESLASVDLVCLDKTGTLTESSLRVVDVVGPDGLAHDARPLRRLRLGPNATLRRDRRAFPAEPAPVDEELPFSSRRRFGGRASAARVRARRAGAFRPRRAREPTPRRAARRGPPVLAFGTARLDAERPACARPRRCSPSSSGPRRARRSTGSASQGVELKVLSGDRPETVAAIARDAGIAGSRASTPGAAGRRGRAAPDRRSGTRVFGRISPEGKRRVVEALRDRRPLRGDGRRRRQRRPRAEGLRLAIAQGSGHADGAQRRRRRARRGDFAAVPAMVDEGRKSSGTCSASRSCS